MNYLLDTNVISAVAPAKRNRPQVLLDWLDQMSDRLFISVITVAEVRDGIAKSARESATRKAADLRAWWDAVEHLYGARILPFDFRAATLAGMLLDRARGAGYAPDFADVAIAAIAGARGLALLTRNTKDFAAFDILVLNPFETLPPLQR